MSSGLYVDLNTGNVNAGTWSLRNAVINGGFTVNQRGTSTNVAAPTAVPSAPPGGWVADRWNVYRGGWATNMTIALGTLATTDLPFTDAGLTKFARMQRSVGDTNTQQLFLTYNFETQDSLMYVNKQVSLSLYYRTGANFSGTVLNTSIVTGTGTDQALRNGLTGMLFTIATTSTASTSWKRIMLTGTVPATATQICIMIDYTPTGTAGAADYVDITGVQLERGAVATPFEVRPFAVELQLAQRFYEIIRIPVNSYLGIYAGSSVDTFFGQTIYCQQTKRGVPSVTIQYVAGSTYWAIPGIISVSAGTFSGLTVGNKTVSSFALNQSRTAGVGTPVNGNVYTFEPSFNCLCDAEL